jgi:anti-anti-sigma factor
MAGCTVTRKAEITLLAIQGRIDSISSPVIQTQLDELIMGGERRIAVNLANVSFLSSAGLRVFLIAQKALAKVGGEILLFRANEGVMRVLTMTGFDRVLRVLATEEELSAGAGSIPSEEISTRTGEGITFTHREIPDAAVGTLRIIGSQTKFASAGYEREDVVTLPQAELLFGTGLATIGEEYEEYKHLFGEALIINHHILFYPAVKRPAADYMLFSGEGSGTECRFLNGFSFDGHYRYMAAFETAEGFVTLERLLEWIQSLPFTSPLLGIVLLAESKGMYGMNLRQVPLRENRPSENFDIYDVAHVASWIDFPVDPADRNHVVAAAGLICRDRGACTAPVQKLFPDKFPAHIHAGIYARGPVSKNLAHFTGELDRIVTELEIHKVQHLLGGSRFSNGMFGLIELKG